MTTIKLGEMTWAEAGAKIGQGAVAVVPVGSLEQHGHLAMETDFMIVTSIVEAAARLAESKGTPMLVTPGIWTGWAPHHLSFPGTISLKRQTLESLLRDVAESLWRHGVRKILLTSGHGGNVNTLKVLVDQLYYEYGGIIAMTAQYWDVAKSAINDWRKSASGGCFHACELETALMMHLSPQGVRAQDMQDVHWVADPRVAGGDLTLPRPGALNAPLMHFEKISPCGSVGDCSLATPERGQEVFTLIVAAMADLFNYLYALDFDSLTQNDLGGL